MHRVTAILWNVRREVYIPARCDAELSSRTSSGAISRSFDTLATMQKWMRCARSGFDGAFANAPYGMHLFARAWEIVQFAAGRGSGQAEEKNKPRRHGGTEVASHGNPGGVLSQPCVSVPLW